MPASASPLVSSTWPGKLILSWKSARSTGTVVRSTAPVTSTRLPARRSSNCTLSPAGPAAAVSAGHLLERQLGEAQHRAGVAVLAVLRDVDVGLQVGRERDRRARCRPALLGRGDHDLAGDGVVGLHGQRGADPRAAASGAVPATSSASSSSAACAVPSGPCGVRPAGVGLRVVDTAPSCHPLAAVIRAPRAPAAGAAASRPRTANGRESPVNRWSRSTSWNPSAPVELPGPAGGAAPYSGVDSSTRARSVPASSARSRPSPRPRALCVGADVQLGQLEVVPQPVQRVRRSASRRPRRTSSNHHWPGPPA